MKILELAIAIKGKLDGSLTSSMQKAMSESKALQEQLKNVNKAMRQAQSAATAEQKATGSVSTAHYREIASLQARINQLTERRADILEKTAAKETAKSNMTASAGQFTKAVGVAAAVTAPLAGMINTAANFEQAMSKVKAITNSSNEDMARLNSTAQQLGATTQFSASQAAEAMTYLGMAGWKTDQIIAGMPGLLNLAAASGSDLATVSDIVSDDLTAFGMSADQAAHMADVMAAASTNANTNVELMGYTFKYVGSLAGALGYSLEDVSVATGIMANAGIKGEQAGTSLRAIMTRLVSPPKEAGTAMDRLGISVTNADGTMKPFMQTMEELRDIFGGMSESEKATYASSIAGQEAMSGFLAIVNASEGDFENLCNAIDNADGASERMAKTMQDNAKGGAIQLQSAIEGVSISIGSIFLPRLASIAGKVAEVVGDFAKWAQENEGLVNTILTVSGAIGGLVVSVLGINAAISTFNYFRQSFELYITVAKQNTLAMKAYSAATKIAAGAQAFFNAVMAGNPLALAAIAIMALVAGLVYLYNTNETFRNAVINAWNEIKNAAMEIWTAIAPIIEVAWEDIKQVVSSGIEILKGLWADISPAVSSALEMIIPIAITVVGFVKNVFVLYFKYIATVVKTAITVVSTVISGLVTVVSAVWEFISTGAASAWDFITNVIDTAGSTITSIVDTVWGVITGIIDTAVGVISAIVETLAPIFSAIWSAIQVVAKVAFIAISLVAIPVIAVIGTAMVTLGAIISTVWQGVKAVASFVWLGIKGAATIVMAAIAQIVSVYVAYIGFIWQGIKTVATYVWNAIQAVVTAVMEAITPVIEAGAAIINAIWEEIQAVATAVWNVIQTVVVTVWGVLVAIITAYVNMIINFWTAIYNAAVSCWNAIVDTVSSVWASVQNIVDQGVASVTQKWENLKSIFSSPIQAVVNFVKGGSSEAADASGVDVAANALGGVYNKPLLTWVAEAGDTEVIVPINNKPRSMALWQTAGRMLGALPATTPTLPAESVNVQTQLAATVPKLEEQAKLTSMTVDLPTTPKTEKPKGKSPLSKIFTALKFLTPISKLLKISSLQKPLAIIKPIINTVADLQKKSPSVPAPMMNMSAMLPTVMQSREVVNNTVAQPRPIALEPANTGNQTINVSFSPNINISGQADVNVVDMIKRALAEQKAQFERELPAMMARMRSNERRLSYG